MIDFQRAEARLTLGVLEFGDQAAAGHCGKLFASGAMPLNQALGVTIEKS